MKRPIQHDKRTKNKRSKAGQTNIAVHPFITITIIAAITLVVWFILLEGLYMFC